MAAKSSNPPKTVLDELFWQDFAQNVWEKKSLVARNVRSDLLEMSAAEIFNLLVLYSDRCRRERDPAGLKFYINGFKVDAEEVLQVLPLKKDKSLLGYHARMQTLFEDYCLVCDELLQVNLEKQHLLKDFTDALYQHVGFPNRFSEMGLYLGNYCKTPFGVHVDACGVFSFPVVGKKRFRLWTPDFVKKHPELDRAFRYDKFKKYSEEIEIGPGDLSYWPSSAWHIAESDGSFSATWSLGVWVDRPHEEMVTASVQSLLRKRLSGANDVMTAFKRLHRADGEVRELPPSYEQAMKLIENLKSAELREIFLTSWMTHISKHGFKTLPRSRVKVSLKSKIKLRHHRALILWQRPSASAKKIYFSFGGSLTESPAAGGLLKLVKALNAGESCAVQEFLKGTHAKQDLVSLQILSDAGAFQ